MPSQAAPPTSVLAGLRASRARLQEERHIDIAIPGYGDALYMRCLPVPWETLREITRKQEKSKAPRRELLAAADTIIHATETLLYRPQDGGELVSLETKWDQRLADLLEAGLEGTPTAREVLFAVFPDDLAVTGIFVELTEWQATGDAEDDDEVGKVRGPTDSLLSSLQPVPSESA